MENNGMDGGRGMRRRSLGSMGGGGGGAARREMHASMSMSDMEEGGRREAAALDIGPGDWIGNYRVLEKRGSGAFGTVYLGEDPDTGMKVAIKALHPESDPRKARARKERLRDTFRLVHGLNNDHIADPVRVEEPEEGPLAGNAFTVMRFAPGVPLSEWRRAHGGAAGTLPFGMAVEICRQIADALDSAHARRGGADGVVHLDIKPDNVMVEERAGGELHVQVLDFGLAHRIDPDAGPVHGVGTPEYIAPEIWEAREAPDGRADQYSLACVLHELLAGEPPFAGVFAAAWRKAESRLPPGADEDERLAALREAALRTGESVVCRAAPPACGALDPARAKALLRGLARDPAERYATCGKMVEAVRRGGAGARAWLSLAVAGLVLATGGAGLSAWQWLESERNRTVEEISTEIEKKGGLSRIAELRGKADAGDADSAHALGRRLAEGIGVDKDPGEALRRFEEAAGRGHAEAMFRAGKCFAEGFGTEPDAARAAEWYRKGSEAGNAESAGAYAECLWDGRGVPQDRAKAEEVARKAVGDGVASAQRVAGLAFVEGVGPEHNLEKGAGLVALAAEAGHVQARYDYSRLLENGMGVPKSPERAAYWSHLAADGGLPAAQLDMAERCAEGRGVAQSPSESERWLQLAARGDPAAAARKREALASASRERDRAAAAEAERARAEAADPFFRLRQRARYGEPAAVFELAKRLDDGLGMEQDPAEAVRWWKELAEMEEIDKADVQRREEAWGRYGFHLYEGSGTRQDVAAAVPWLEKFAAGVKSAETLSFSVWTAPTAKSGPAEPEWATDRKQVQRGRACWILAQCRDTGTGCAKSASKANEWLETGGETGNRDCLDELVRRVSDGRFTMLQTEKAVWYRRAADAGNEEAKELLADVLRGGSGMRKGTPAKASADGGGAEAEALYAEGCRYRDGKGVAKNTAKAVERFRAAAGKGHAGAQAEMGVRYEDGDGVPRDLRQAAEWYRKAAAQGHNGAKWRLAFVEDMLGGGTGPDGATAEELHAEAFCYLNGNGIPRNDAKGAACLQKAAEKGLAKAQYALGVLYREGRGVPRDLARSAEWTRKAAIQGHVDAQMNLAVACSRGDGVPRDEAQAASWFRKAAEQGSAEGQYAYGARLYDGKGVRQNQPEAVQWFRKAAAQGHAGAKSVLRQLGM